MRIAKVVLVALFGFLAPGCVGTAQVFYQDAAGGVLALHGMEDRAMEDAVRQMTLHCGPSNFVIVRRETVVVGQENYSQTDYAERERTQEQVVQNGGTVSQQGYGEQTSTHATPTPYGPGATTTTQGGGYQSTAGYNQTDARGQTVTQGGSSSVSGVRDVRETRVHYQCRQGAAALPVPGAAPAPMAPSTYTPPPGAPVPQPPAYAPSPTPPTPRY
jgi:hypothetical protein